LSNVVLIVFLIALKPFWLVEISNMGYSCIDEFTAAEKEDCEASEHSCGNGQCIPKAYFCDRFRDCDDGSDEPIGCGGDCAAQEFRCGNGRCIKNHTVCDGLDTCGDGSDEFDCSPAAAGRGGQVGQQQQQQQIVDVPAVDTGNRPILRHSGAFRNLFIF
jgi:hypothetical protein